MQPWPDTLLTGTHPWSDMCAQQQASPRSAQAACALSVSEPAAHALFIPSRVNVLAHLSSHCAVMECKMLVALGAVVQQGRADVWIRQMRGGHACLQQ